MSGVRWRSSRIWIWAGESYQNGDQIHVVGEQARADSSRTILWIPHSPRKASPRTRDRLQMPRPQRQPGQVPFTLISSILFYSDLWTEYPFQQSSILCFNFLMGNVPLLSIATTRLYIGAMHLCFSSLELMTMRYIIYHSPTFSLSELVHAMTLNYLKHAVNLNTKCLISS